MSKKTVFIFGSIIALLLLTIAILLGIRIGMKSTSEDISFTKAESTLSSDLTISTSFESKEAPLKTAPQSENVKPAPQSQARPNSMIESQPSSEAQQTLPRVTVADYFLDHMTEQWQYVLTPDETSEFMRLYKNVKLELIRKAEKGTVHNPGTGMGECEITVDYGDHVDDISLPEFTINWDTYKATAGAQEFISFINNLAIYRDRGIDICETTMGPYAIGREDGLIHVTLYTNTTTTFLPVKDFDTILDKMSKVSFSLTGEKVDEEIFSISNDFETATIAFIYHDPENPSWSYILSPVWAKSEPNGSIKSCTICEVDGEVEELITYLHSFDCFKGIEFSY